MLGVELLLQPTIVWFWPYPTCIFYPQLINWLWLRVDIFLSIYLSIYLPVYEWLSIYLFCSICPICSACESSTCIIPISRHKVNPLLQPKSALRHSMLRRDCLANGDPCSRWVWYWNLHRASSLIGRGKFELPALLMHLKGSCTLNSSSQLLDSRSVEEQNGRSQEASRHLCQGCYH